MAAVSIHCQTIILFDRHGRHMHDHPRKFEQHVLVPFQQTAEEPFLGLWQCGMAIQSLRAPSLFRVILQHELPRRRHMCRVVLCSLGMLDRLGVAYQTWVHYMKHMLLW